jgi:hypothetical protein
MDLVGEAFALFLERVTPPPTQRRAAQSGHNTLRGRLEGDAYFGSLIRTTFLNGSYARHTVVRPIRDVDIIAVVGTDWMEADPARAMESLRRKLAQWYDGWRTRRRRRAVQVQLSRVNLDVLLATAPDGMDSPLRIPDRDLRRWIRTHPKRQRELTEQLRTETNGNYPRLVRLLKAWASNRVAEAYVPASFVLECSAFHVVAGEPARFAGALEEGFVALLEGLYGWDFGRSGWYSWSRPTVTDPGLPDMNVAERWDAAGADGVRRKLKVALQRCAEIERSRWEETAVGKWAELFGGLFPTASGVLRQQS